MTLGGSSSFRVMLRVLNRECSRDEQEMGKADREPSYLGRKQSKGAFTREECGVGT